MNLIYVLYGLTALCGASLWLWFFKTNKWFTWLFGVSSTAYLLFIAFLVPFMAENADSNFSILFNMLLRMGART